MAAGIEDVAQRAENLAPDGVVAEESILRLFLAGLGAGLLFALLMIIYSIWRAIRRTAYPCRRAGQA